MGISVVTLTFSVGSCKLYASGAWTFLFTGCAVHVARVPFSSFS